MKKSSFGATVITLLLIGAASYCFRAQIVDSYGVIADYINPPKPCSRPIVYDIGMLNADFGITRKEFLQDVAAATQIWGRPFSRDFFEYAGAINPATGRSYASTTKNIMTINLIYDYRQKATTQLSRISTTISSGSAAYSAMKNQYDALAVTYAGQKTQLTSMIAAYDAEKAAYTAAVASANARGGASASQYASLEAKRQELNAQADAINQAQTSMSSLVDTLNANAASLNEAVAGLNSNVTAYNNIGSETGPQFEEGEYVRDGSGQHIDIYQYDDKDKLIRVLAHELGHSLGLDHVSDPSAIMYASNQGTGQSLSGADTAELKKVCDIL